ncbi:MAG: metal-dependent hydrolase [Candidatus Magasanikbacteria bacterium]|uniref:Hydrolase n=1 Tax=Candidatus Magasanikbacteria bacterium CG10_big_fil_rev_8_21_14_0_10_38_6 TaxID=1974647 RepID=A0A2M6NZY4_9BACT|nr:metal-dependent hydrolase [Candidatus Magasanikbacteria bacterium]NCS72309.1 metal-dependent hydrolase [Candidatus Magasanikbacteria bacterium]PIR77043.1 MAG: hydrolase [Candidatus Magasanikbacteria bacterium CG10_big_fil_rev_8_21_14_0_10_38_6]
MFIGHIPSGYILSTTLQKRFFTQSYLFWGLLGSVFPDIDILYFYLIDDQQHLHHSYWIHVPFYWMIITAVTLSIFFLRRRFDYIIAAVFFFSTVFLHLILDTLVGKIAWFFPFTDRAVSLFEVPAVYSFWIYNFIFHWTFLFEIAAIVWALILFMKHKKTSHHG